MLGLGLALSIGKRVLGDAIDSLLSALRGRATYYENGSASKSTIKAIDDADILDKATILLTPTATSNARVHSVKTYTGDELVTDGDFSLTGTQAADTTGTYWTTGASWSIESGVASSDGGASYLTSGSSFRYTIGNTYKVSLEITERNSGSVSLPFDGTGSNTNYQDSIGVKTAYIVAGANNPIYIYSNSFDGKIDNLSIVDVSSDFDFDRASSATRINSSANVEDITSDLARINYDSNGDNGHILLEPTSTNLITYSEDFSEWTTTTATLTSNQSSPDGYNNAYIIEDDDASAFERVDETITTVASSHTFSVFIKKKTSAVSSYSGIQMGTGFSYVIFDSYNGTYNQQSNTNYDSVEVENFSSDWWRLKLTATVTTSTRVALWGAISTNGTSISPSATGSETFYGAQLEALPYATSYIPTLTGSTVTRATETLTGSGNSTLINSTEGVLYAEIAALAEDGIKKYISLSDGSTSNDVRLYFDTSGYISALSKVGGSTQVFIQSNAYTQTDFNKVAFKYKVNDFALWINGVEVATDNSGSTNTANSLDELNFNGNNLDFYGKCKALAVFNEALSDTELENLTS